MSIAISEVEAAEDRDRVERVLNVPLLAPRLQSSPLVAKIESIIQGQREEAELPFQEFGWFGIFCHECEMQETSPKPESLTQFAEKVFNLGWHVLHTGRFQILCPACANAQPNESDYAIQYQQASGGLIS